MTPEQKAREIIDKKLEQSGWIVQDMKQLNLFAGLGVAVREFPTSTGPVDYALFVDGTPVGIIEAKKDDAGENITAVEGQSNRYVNSTFKWIKGIYRIRFVYEATGKLTRFTDYDDIKYRSRNIFTFHQPQELQRLMKQPDTIRNRMKQFPDFDTTGFRKCQITAISNLEKSFAANKPKALIQMATGAGKTFTAITTVYRLLKHTGVNRVLFLVDTKGLGEQAEREFLAYRPNDDNRSFSELYGVRRLKSSFIPSDVQVCISTIQRMYSILRGEELDESTEGETFYENSSMDQQSPKEVVYNSKYPPEFFDVIIIDECHRSIYNVWKQVLEYFDSFQIGLTATPDKRTFAYFDQNVVSEYSREMAIIDGVNVGEDIFLIETEVGKQGGTILKQQVEYRNRLSREKRWAQLDEDVNYRPSQLDRDIVNPSQIRTVVRAFKDALYTSLFPRRKEVPKTLIFAKTDSHADDIIQIVREEFGEGNEFCKKVTYSAENPEAVLSSFRNDYYPRIAVTVDMIATGTDVKPIECLIFMRDVRSKNYFEQMKGRGTRTLGRDDLQKVTPSATENKDHFVIVDAVGVTKSKKSDTRTLERKPSVSLKNLMMNVALGARDEDTLTSLASRIIRLNSQMTASERKAFTETVGIPAGNLAEKLLDAFDEDVITARAQAQFGCETPTPEQYAQVQKEAITDAVKPFHNPEARDFIENIRRSHEQIIDNVNIDTVTFAGFDTQQEANADRVIQSFRDFIEANKDEIIALRIIYSQNYKDRPMVINKLQSLYEKLKAQGITIDRLWDCYAIKKPDKVRGKSTMHQLADLIAIIRFEMGYGDNLQPFAETVNYTITADDKTKRKQEYVGKVKKCPACGEEIPALTAICPACGHELNSTKVSESLSKFISQIEECDRRISNSPKAPKKGWSTWKTGKRVGWVILNIFFGFIPLVIYFLRPYLRTDKAPSLTKEEKVKASIIENFAFPNDRESILEALLFIKSKVAVLATEKVNANNAYWTRLWTKKAEELHHKAQIMFPGDIIAAEAFSEIVNNNNRVRKALKIRVITSVVLLVAFFIFTGIRNGSFDDLALEHTPVVIPDTELSALMPQIEGGKGEVVTNNSFYFTVDYYGISEQEFEEYKDMCKNAGFTIDCENDGSLFDAYNDDGYNIRVTYHDKKMHVSVEDKVDMVKFIWPDSEIASLLPIPKSDYGKLSSSSDTCIIVYIGNTSVDEFNDYVFACMEKGFDNDVSRNEHHFHADNDDGYHVIVEYRGYNTMFIRIDD